MNCPKCGLQTQPDQRFCRSCGDNLKIITTPLAGAATISPPASTTATVFKNEARRARSMLLWGVILMFIGVVIGVIGKMLLHEEIVTVVGILFSVLGMFFTAFPYLLPAPRQKYDSIASSQPEGLKTSQPTRHLSPQSNVENVPSITERTTELLKNSAAPRPGQKKEKESTPDNSFNPAPR
jgi:hypothetical protein